jgi:chitodextrinase
MTPVVGEDLIIPFTLGEEEVIEPPGEEITPPPVEENIPIIGEYPLTWRTSPIEGLLDPRPIDAEMSVVFNTGTQEGYNSFTVGMREASEAFISQLDLESPPYETQGNLDGRSQPDYGVSQFEQREIGALDNSEMETLDRETMRDLEEIENPIFSSWIFFRVSWGGANQAELGSSTGQVYVIPTKELLSDANYVAICKLEDTRARLTIYRLNSNFTIVPGAVFDSSEIEDGNTFARRKGKIGWAVSIEDPESSVVSINPRHFSYAEYRSAPLTSITPVAGAQLFANFTPNIELWQNFSPGPNNEEEKSTLERDTSRSTTGNSYRLNVISGTNQGIISNAFSLTELSQAGISFDLWYPSELPKLSARLLNHFGGEIKLALPALKRNQWQRITVPLEHNLMLTGEYQLYLEQGEEGVGTWWVDNVSIFQRAVQWSARSVVDDPWKSIEAPWTDFREVINTESGGIQFPIRGNNLQVRAKALTQEATIIGSPKVKPRYAQLGRLVWPENVRQFDPEALFTASVLDGPAPEFVPIGHEFGKEYGTLTVDSTYIYYWDESLFYFYRASIAGGSPEKIPISFEGIDEEWEATHICVDSTNIYWCNGRAIWKAPIAGGDATKILLYPISGTTAVGAKSLIVDETYLYWIKVVNNKSTKVITKTIQRAPKGAVPLVPEEYIKDPDTDGSVPTGLSINSTFIYWGSPEKIYRGKLSETEPKPTAIVTLPSGSLMESTGLSASKLYFSWIDATGKSWIGVANLTGSSPTYEWYATGQPESNIAVDASYIYYQANTSIGRVPREGLASVLTWSFASISFEGSSPIVSYEWDFGDSATGVGANVLHTYAAKGTYTVKLKITDVDGLTSTTSKSITF